MNRAFSIYLDLVRFIAAVLVYLWHSNNRNIVEGQVPFGSYGPSAVVAFFVLSGFVIAYVVDTKESDWRRYAAGRTARVFSVVVPVLVLTLAMDTIGRSQHIALYAGAYPYDQLFVRTLGSFLMLNEAWFVSITFLSNVPYWSIAYEWWYYVLFGLSMFVPGRWKWPSVIGAAVLIGPKIILLWPIWYAGVTLYRWHWPTRMSLGLASGVVVVSVVGIVLWHTLGFRTLAASWFQAVVGPQWLREFAFSKYFIGDYLLGVLVWMNFAGMRKIAPAMAPVFLAIAKPVAGCASLTFTLYLLHQPAMLFWAAILRGNSSGWGYWWSVTALTSATIIVVSHLTEQRRFILKAGLERILGRLHPMP